MSYSLYFKTALHLCQLYYLFVAKPKHATDVRNDGVTYLLHPLNNPLTTLKPQYSMRCETCQVITAMDGLFNFTMSQRSDRQDLSTHKVMICQRNNRQVCRSVTQTFDNLHGAPVRLLGHIMKKKTKIEKSTMYSAMHKNRYKRKFMF